MPRSTSTPLLADLMLPELERQMIEDQTLWPNVKGLFIITVTKKRKPVSTWYMLLQGNQVEPLITTDKDKARAATKSKLRTVKIQIEDSDLLNFITGGLTGVKAYMSGRIKVRGDLVLAQSLETVFEKANGRDRALTFIKNNEELLAASKGKL